MLMSKNYERCGIVADRYFEGSLKEGTRNKRGAGASKLIFSGESLMPKDSSSNFLANSKNKKNLNIFLAKKFVNFQKNPSQVLVVTLNDGVFSNKEYVFTEEIIAYCNVEEADARLIRHGINLSNHGYKNILIHTVDSDVLLLSIAYANKMIENGTEFINVNLGTGLDAKTCDVIQLRDMIGHHHSLALPFFHAFTGCDTTSNFYRYGKCKFWDTWMREDPEVTSTFIELSNAPTEIKEDQICKIENFLVSIYYPGQKYLSIDDTQLKNFFRSPAPDLRSIIISRSGLIQHIKCSALQVGWVWKGCENNINIPDPTTWGWLCLSLNQLTYCPKWCETPDDTKKCILTCSCKSFKYLIIVNALKRKFLA